MYNPEKVWNRFAKRFEKSPVSDEGIYQEKLRITREYFTPESNVLEIGCGTGTTAVAHAPFVNHIDAMDVADKMLEFGREKAAQADVKNVTFIRADISSFAIPDKKYDVIMGHSILHLLDDKEMVIRKVFDMLKPGGFFISSTLVTVKKRPILAAVMGAVLKIGKATGLLPLVRLFSVDELVQSITSAGFEINHNWLPDKSDALFLVAKKPG